MSIPAPSWLLVNMTLDQASESTIPPPPYATSSHPSRLRSLSFSAIESYLSLSFRHVTPVFGAPAPSERAKYTDIDGIDSLRTVVRRKTKLLSLNWAKGEKLRKTRHDKHAKSGASFSRRICRVSSSPCLSMPAADSLSSIVSSAESPGADT